MRPTFSRLASHQARRCAAIVMVLLGALWLVIRFVGLEIAPSGFWEDEAWDAAQAMCLAETGHDADGKPWPLFARATAGGTLPLTWTAPMVAWTRIFGTSIRSFRTPSVLWILLTSAGLFAIGRALIRIGDIPGDETRVGLAGDKTRVGLAADPFPLLVLFAALVSPWSFQFSRIAWEGPIAPAFLVLSLWAMIRLQASGSVLWAVLSGIFGACSMISYPPLRAAVPFVLTFAGLLLLAGTPGGPARRALWIKLATTAAVLGLTFSPVILMILRGQGTERMMYVSIFSPEWLDSNRHGTPRLSFFALTFLDNLFLHLRPSYLFLRGDGNLRHSSHLVGQLSPVDALAVSVALGLLTWLAGKVARQVSLPTAPAWPRLQRREQLLVVVALYSTVAGMFGSVPAALTWESVPHALRSIGAWPFVALFSGAVLAIGWTRISWLPAVTASVALVYTVLFLPGYFAVYRRVDPDVFHRDLSEALAVGRAENPPRAVAETLRPFLPRYDDTVFRYFLMRDGGQSCRESDETLSRMRREK